MNGTRATSWNDLIIMPPADPRSLISFLALTDQTGATQLASFLRSATWLNAAKTWVNPPISTSLPGFNATSHIVATNPYDFDAVIQTNEWNTTQAMTLPVAGLPIAAQKIMYLKADPRFTNFVYFDFAGATTSTDIQLSFRDNSTTSGNFQNSGVATVPVLAFPNSATYGGTGRALQVSLTKPGRYVMGLRIVDNTGNWSMFEMDWIVL